MDHIAPPLVALLTLLNLEERVTFISGADNSLIQLSLGLCLLSQGPNDPAASHGDRSLSSR